MDWVVYTTNHLPPSYDFSDIAFVTFYYNQLLIPGEVDSHKEILSHIRATTRKKKKTRLLTFYRGFSCEVSWFLIKIVSK